MKKRLFYIGLLLTIITNLNAQPCLENDSLELVKIYNDCGGANWTITWNLNAPLRTWNGVFLTADGCGVDRIELEGQNLAGDFPYINLDNLELLYLRYNRLTTVPDFSGLNNLNRLDLMGNLITDLPDFSNLPILSHINLSFNQLTTIPDFSSIPGLKEIWLWENELTEVPDFTNLPNLDWLYLGSNDLTEVPDFSNLPSLTRLTIHNNNLTAIPNFTNLPNLTGLDLHGNKLQVPDFSNLPNLTWLSLGWAGLTEIPNFTNLPNLTTLVLHDNSLTSVPDFTNLSNLTTLSLGNNQLATIPNFTNLPNLEVLLLDRNKFTSPPDLSSLNLSWLRIDQNQFNFSGLLPLTILDSLTYAPQDSLLLKNLAPDTYTFPVGGDLADNTYTWYKDSTLFATNAADSTLAITEPGYYRCEATNTQLPDLTLHSRVTFLATQDCLEKDSLELVSIYNDCGGANWNTPWDLNAPVRTWNGVTLTTVGCGVSEINLTGNNLVDTFPDIELRSLSELRLGYNQLTTIPDFSDLPNLKRLSINRNELIAIPDFSNLDMLIELNFQHNQLVTVPDFTNLTSLTWLDLGSNELTIVPDFSNLPNLNRIYINDNLLTTIPDFSNLPNLTHLQAPFNQLTTLPELSNLSNLYRLDVGYNQLTTIPDFADLYNLRILWIRFNGLTSLPAFPNSSNFTELWLNSNQLNFSTILPFLGMDNFRYAPQDSLSLQNLAPGTYTFPVGGDLADNTYTWYKDNVLYATIIADSTLAITESGYYRCEATNIQLPDLTLYSKEIYMEFQRAACITHDSLQLLKIYNACDGPNWDTLWTLSQPISTWHGISLTADGCKVEAIEFGFFGNGLQGTFPALDLGELKTLNLIRNELSAIESLDQLPSLEFLELSDNQLTELPPLENLVSLENLHLANNQLAQVPDYSNLSRLRVLSLFNNQLQQVPDYSNLVLLEQLHLYGNQLSSIFPYDGLTSLAFLSLENNRLDFSDIRPFADDFSYAPQDSLALSLSNTGDLIFQAGGDLANNTYTWYKDNILQSANGGNNTFSPNGAGRYRCEARNNQLPDLVLYSKEINICGVAGSLASIFTTQAPPFCKGVQLDFGVFGPPASTYSFYVNGQLMQSEASNLFTSDVLSDGDLISAILEDEQGCQTITPAYPVELEPAIDLLICQIDSTTINAKLKQGTPTWAFNLVEYKNNALVEETIYSVTSNSIDLPQKPYSYYEFTELLDANCSSEMIYTSPHIGGCGAVCVGYSEPQYEYYRAYFGKPVTPSSLNWTVTPTDALTQGDIELVGNTNDFVLQLNFPTKTPVYNTITLSVSAETDCGTETLYFPILLDPACIWPGDITDDGEARTGSPGIPWIDDAIALSRAITTKNAINNSQNNESLISPQRPASCLAEKPYDWVPQSAKNWQVDSAGTLRDLNYQLFDNNGNIMVSKNLKYADADGNGNLEDNDYYDSFNDDFETLSTYSDIDVVAYHELLGNTHAGNAPATFKVQNVLPELLTITVPDTVYANGDEVVFVVTLGDSLNSMAEVVQVAFRAEGRFGTYQRPAVDLTNSHLSISHSDLADYPKLRPNFEGIPADSLEWLLSLHSADYTPVTFAGEEVCSIICHATVAAFSDSPAQAKKLQNTAGIPRKFKITAGVLLENGSIRYVQSNEVTIYIQPDPQLAATVILEGAYETNEGLMHDRLREQGQLPISEPFSSLPSYYFPKEGMIGLRIVDPTSTLAVTGPEAIVDWVFVEIWQDSTHLSSRPALLTRSGKVVDMDGVSALPLTRVPYGNNYDIVLRHRNHLPVKTMLPISLGPDLAVLDFSAGGATLQAELTTGIYGLLAGDATCIEHDCQGGYSIDNEDKLIWSKENGNSNIYSLGDFNMSTDINGLDKLLWSKNNGKSVNILR